MAFISSWGRLGNFSHHVTPLSDHRLAPVQIKSSENQSHASGLAFGNGRSYGDVALNPGGALWTTLALDHFIAFDEHTGLLRCEAGVLLQTIQRVMMPKGWMLAVTPGTQLVTVGGAIANDVHGKNHHVMGSFGDHVKAIRLARTDGLELECTPQENSDWLHATIGGLGLTGLILEVTLQLRPVASPWLISNTKPFYSLNEFFEMYAHAEKAWEHTVAWIDCGYKGRGRGLLLAANHLAASPAHLPNHGPDNKTRRFPFVPPFSLVNRLSLTPFNFTYFHLNRLRFFRASRPEKTHFAHYEKFFYPLDSILEWNRLYGPRGFYQYQSLLPWRDGKAATQEMLGAINRSGLGSFLAVIKTFGERPAPGMLSFVRPGITLALDFPAGAGEHLHQLFARLDAIVQEAGGHLYCAKDARMPRAMFETGYPALEQWSRYRDPGISSAMSRRLMGW